MVDEITPKIKNALYAFISTDLEILGAITQKTQFVVCHDGGYMHFAASLGIPVVGMSSITENGSDEGSPPQADFF